MRRNPSNPPSLLGETFLARISAKDNVEERFEVAEYEEVQCPCGRIIKSPREYIVLFLGNSNEINLLCPNELCYLEELGKISFSIAGRSVTVKEAYFNTFFYQWNFENLGEEKARILLEDHLRTIITREIDWQTLIEGAKGSH